MIYTTLFEPKTRSIFKIFLKHISTQQRVITEVVITLHYHDPIIISKQIHRWLHNMICGGYNMM